MCNHIRKINHKGEVYYSLDDVVDLVNKSKSIDELKSILIPAENPLSDFNQKLMQGLNFNPKESNTNKEQCEQKLVEHRRLKNQIFHHKSGSHTIKITDVKCIQKVNDEEYYVNCDYDNLSNNRNGVITPEVLHRDYSLSAIDRL